MPRKREAARVAEAARLYHEAGLTRDEVAARMGVQGSTVARWLAGTARPRGPRKREDVSDAEILALRDEDHLSFQEIAQATGMSKTGVRLRYATLTGRERPDRPKRQSGGSAGDTVALPSRIPLDCSVDYM